jgi:hypothetical protein
VVVLKKGEYMQHDEEMSQAIARVSVCVCNDLRSAK